MIDEEDINFIKVFLILMKGGTFSCRKIVQGLVTQSGKSLENLLEENRQALNDPSVCGHLPKKQFEKLFPRNNQSADIAQWDISLLTFVLLNVFNGSFNSPEIAAIKAIRDTRNNVIGHGAESKVTNTAFACTWLHVTMAFRQLSRMLAPDDLQEYFAIESSIMDHPFQNDIIEQLEEIGPTDTFIQAVVNSIMPKVHEKIAMETEENHRKKFEEMLQRLERMEEKQAKQEQIQQTQGQQIALLTNIKVNTGSTRSRRQVERHILEASNKVICNGPDVDSSDDEVLSAVRDLFKGMEEQGVRVVKADEGSILLTVLCPTIKSMRNLASYFKSPQIQQKLTHIKKAVGICHTCETEITADVDQNSLETAIKRLEKELDVGAVCLTLECSGIGGVRNAFQLFENGESAKTLNKLSEALSHTVGEKAELQTAIDLDKLEEELEKVEKKRKKQLNDRKREEDKRKRQEQERRKREEEDSKRREEEEKKKQAKEKRRREEEAIEKEKEKEKQKQKAAGVGAIATGAMIGAALGPVGITVGGAIGAMFSFWNNDDSDSDSDSD